MSQRLRVGVGQFGPSVDRLGENLTAHLTLVEKARTAGCALLVFPELSLSGFPDTAAHVAAAAEWADDPDTRLAHLVRATAGMAIVAGFVEEGEAAQFFNSAAVIADGKIQAVHRKVSLATYGRLHEGKLFGAGHRPTSVPLTRAWRVGVTICADAFNPGLVHATALGGSTCLAIPANSAIGAVTNDAFDNPTAWQLATRFYAIAYGMPVAMANRTGAEHGLTFWGGSHIVDPFGQIVATGPSTTKGEATSEPTLVVGDVDYGDVRRARLALPTVRDARAESFSVGD